MHDGLNSARSDADEILIDAASPPRGIDLRELWCYRDLLFVLARRDVAVRYRQTALGVLWALIQPAASMAVFSLVFGRFGHMPSDDIPYYLFAFAGLLPWQFFSSALGAVGMSVVNSGRLIDKVYFPRLIIPIAALGAPFLDMLISSAFMFLLMAFSGHWPSLRLLWLPGLFLLIALVALGVGTLIAALAMAYRDFRHLLQPLVTIWLFLTPVIYPSSLVPEQWRFLVFLNPVAGVVDASRAVWFARPFDPVSLGMSVAISLVVLAIGIIYFRSVERRFADLI